MSALARYYASLGMIVAGYDRTPSPITSALAELGYDIHFDDNVEAIPLDFRQIRGTLVVYTPALPHDSAELAFFRDNGFLVRKRSEVLGVIAASYNTFAVAGTHGKTSTSAMLTNILACSANGCDAILGGISKNLGSNLLIGDRGKRMLVVEADEYDRSFLTLNPSLAIVTSVDPDHLDVYGTHDSMIDAFEQFVFQIRPKGYLVKRHGIQFDPLLPAGVSSLTYGLEPEAVVHPVDIQLVDGFYHFSLSSPFGDIDRLQLGVPGRYNFENAMAAATAALLLGIKPDEIRNGLKTFTGVARRFDLRFRSAKTLYFDDYAHHPKEIAAMVDSLREIYPNRSITGIFQPHLFSRTRDFAPEFAAALDRLDVPVVLDIYPAREKPIKGITQKSILTLMRNKNKIGLKKEQVLQWLQNQHVDILLTMGAGNIDRLVPKIVELLKANDQHPSGENDK